MKIDISTVVKSPGMSINFDVSQELLELNNKKWNIEFLKPVTFKGKVENINDVVLLNGIINTSYKTNCDRCGIELTKNIDLEVNEDLVNVEQIEDDEEKAIELFTFEGNQLDLYPILLNYILLNIPMSHLCSETCKGICQKCGKNLNDGECNCSDSDDNIDPRLEKLKDIFK